MIVPTISLLIASPINILLNWLLVWGPPDVRLGFLGAPLATAISFNLMVRTITRDLTISAHLYMSEFVYSLVHALYAVLPLPWTSRRLGRLKLADIEKLEAKHHAGLGWLPICKC